MKRLISILLCFLILLSAVPVTAAAQAAEPYAPSVQLQDDKDDAGEAFNYFVNLGHALQNFVLYTLASPAALIMLMVVTGPAAPFLLLTLVGVSIADLGRAIIGQPTEL